MQKKELNLKEAKKIFLKIIPALRKEIKNADEFEFEINRGIFDLPDSEKRQVQHCYDGNVDISMHIYSKKNDKRKELLKNRQ